jgi:hypothetical protein
MPTLAPYPASNTYLPSPDRDKFPSALAEPDKVRGQLFPDENIGKGKVVFPGVGDPSVWRYSRKTGVELFVKTALPSPTRNTTNDVEPLPPPLELELDDEELDELDDEDAFPPEDELELDDALELLFPLPPMPLLDEELLEDWAPHWPASPPSPPSLFPRGRVVP